MIIILRAVVNEYINVTLQKKPFITVIVIEKSTNQVIQMFSGFDVESMYNDFEDNINEEVDVETTLHFFKTKANQI